MAETTIRSDLIRGDASLDVGSASLLAMDAGEVGGARPRVTRANGGDGERSGRSGG